ncbi:MAG: VWA domain-containing protein [Deltaproteobacteria bacterium]|nr:VWA domain-containing protein [Deltaproteobacteria bacterium]
MFIDFFQALRRRGVPVTTHNWLALVQAVIDGLHGQRLDGFYRVARCLCCASEQHYDGFDQAFAEVFRGVVGDGAAVLAELDEFLRDPKKLAFLDPALRAALQSLDLETLRRMFEERLAEQRKRHEGGNRWIGTGGTSPFGQGGVHPSGVRMGGSGGGRSALAVADARRFRAYRSDLVLDTRQIAAALRRLRKMARKGDELELDVPETVDATARNCGDLEIAWKPPRKNDVRVLLMMDVGGSMDPFAQWVSQLFSAASRGGGFRELKAYYFHNCVYGRVYEDAAFTRGIATTELLRDLDHSWRLVMVGDAYMHPGELMMSSSDWWQGGGGPVGITWLARLADRFPHAAWLNPEKPDIWDAPTIAEVRRVFAMFPLTLDGLGDMVAHLRRPPSPARSQLVHQLAHGESLPSRPRNDY